MSVHHIQLQPCTRLALQAHLELEHTAKLVQMKANFAQYRERSIQTEAACNTKIERLAEKERECLKLREDLCRMRTVVSETEKAAQNQEKELTLSKHHCERLEAQLSKVGKDVKVCVQQP